jgi:hypothetical protein
VAAQHKPHADLEGCTNLVSLLLRQRVDDRGLKGACQIERHASSTGRCWISSQLHVCDHADSVSDSECYALTFPLSAVKELCKVRGIATALAPHTHVQVGSFERKAEPAWHEAAM